MREILLKYENYCINVRRHIHKYPGVGFEVNETIDFIASELDKLKVEYYKNVGISSLVAVLKGKTEKPVIGIRADIDALEIEEENDIEYKSVYPKKMHACGHDAHGAMLLTLIKVIVEEKIEFDGTLKCIFQAAEEGPVSGGILVCEDGIVDDVEVFFAHHVSPALPTGMIGLKYGELNASCDDFIITLFGKGTHAAYPHQGIDPIQMAVEVYSAINLMKNRELDPIEKAVISICVIESGTTFNAVPEKAVIKGTFRTYNNDLRKQIKLKMENIVKSIATMHNGTYEIEFLEGIVPLINSYDVVDYVKGVALKTFGEDKVHIFNTPSMGGDDFSYYVDKAKGAMIIIGVGNPDKGCNIMNHNPRFNIDEDGLIVGIELYLQAIMNYNKKQN